MLGFASSHDDESFGHSQEGIHSGGVAVELVEDDMAGVHHLLVLGKRHVLCNLDTDPFRPEIALQAEEGGVHQVGAFVGRAGTLDTEEEIEGGGLRV